MTAGQMVFYGGIGLLVFTWILALIFWRKKPKYEPSSAVYEGAEEKGTQKLRNAYPTMRLTKRWKQDTHGAAAKTAPLPETEKIDENVAGIGGVQTVALSGGAEGTQVLTDAGTAVLGDTILEEPAKSTEVLAENMEGTVPLIQPSDKTEPLTELIMESETQKQTEPLQSRNDETVLLSENSAKKESEEEET